MKRKSFKSIGFCNVLLFLLTISITSACTLDRDKDISYIRQNLEDFQAQTVPYQDNILFTLSTDQILNGIAQPVKITSIYDTDVYVIETYEKINSINKDEEVDIVIGFDSHVKTDGSSGKLLSHFRLNGDDTYTTGNVVLRAFDENGELGDFGSGSGDHEGQFEQFFLYTFEKEEIASRKELTFDISGLYLLEYFKK